MAKLNELVIIVSGATGGIGQAIVKRLQEEGAIVVATDVTASPQETNVEFIQADLARPEEIRALFQRVDEKYGRIDGLVNNAGVNRRATTMDVTVEEWDFIMDVNLRGTFFMCQEACRRMIQQKRGAIVNIASSAAKVGGKIAGIHYSIAKAGVNAMTMLIAKDMAAHGIRVNSICPGPIDTPFHSETTDAERERAIQNIPLGRFGKPEEIAAVVSFLLSEDASYMTGEILDVNGGLIMD